MASGTQVDPRREKRSGWVRRWRGSGGGTGRGPQIGFNTARLQETAKRELEQKVSDDMGEIVEARQFLLTVDGELYRAKQEDVQSPLVRELTQFSTGLVAYQTELDTRSKETRKKAEEENYISASLAFDAGLVAARAILATRPTFNGILSKHGSTPPPVLAGQTKPEEVEFLDRFEKIEPEIKRVLAVDSECDAITTGQRQLEEWYDDCLEMKSTRSYDDADYTLGLIETRVFLLDDMDKGYQKYRAKYRELDNLLSHSALLKLNDPLKLKKQGELISLHIDAQSEANAGYHDSAIRKLEDAARLAQEIAPDGGEAALSFESEMAQAVPVFDEAASVKVPCDAIKEDQTVLGQYRVEIEQYANDLDFRAAAHTIGTALVRADWILRQANGWREFVSAKSKRQETRKAAEAIDGDNALQVKQTAMANAWRLADEEAQKGEFKAAQDALAEAGRLAGEILTAGGSGDMAAFYREYDSVKGEIEKAKVAAAPCKVIQQAKDSLDEVLKEMQDAIDASDFSGALHDLSIAQTRAYYVLHGIETYQTFQRQRARLITQIQKAAQVVHDDPQVGELQTAMNQHLNAADTAIDVDLQVALTRLKEAHVLASRVLAYEETAKRQRKRHEELQEVLQRVNDNYLPEGGAENAGEHLACDQMRFNVYLAALSIVEKDKSEQNVIQLENASHVYLKFWDTLGEEAKNDEKNIRRKKLVESTLVQTRQLLLAKKLENIGAPPWDQDQEDLAADLAVKVLFEEADLPLEGDDSGGVMGAKWIKRMDFEEEKGQRAHIFKRVDTPIDLPGMPSGGEAPREVLADTVGKSLGEMTGLDFAVPETRIIGISPTKLGVGGSEEILGSAQTAAPTVGSVLDKYFGEPEFLEKIPPKETQKMALFDMVAMNMDRHPGNLLIGPEDENGNMNLVPIDNGLAFPSREFFDNRRGKICKSHVLNKIPGSFEPFDQDVQEAIESIDVDKIIDDMKERIEALQRQHPDMDPKGKMSPETENMMRRSVEFMKKACKKLSPAFLMETLLLQSDAIFDTPDEEKEAKFDEIIREQEEKATAYAPIAKMTIAEKKQFFLVHRGLGWNCHLEDPTWGANAWQEWDMWARKDPRKVLEIHARKVVNRAIVAETQRLIQEILACDPDHDIRQKVAGRNTYDAHNDAETARQRLEEKIKELALARDFADFFPKQPLPEDEEIRSNWLAAYEQFVRWGGKNLTKMNGKKIKDSTPFADRFEYLRNAGDARDLSARDDIIRSPEFREMTRLFDRLDVSYPNWQQKHYDAVKEQLDAWREFQGLGGFKKFCATGGDTESLFSPLTTAINHLRHCKMAEDTPLDG